VSAALQAQELLLVLDGFEYVLNERMRVAELLEAHAGLVVLVTTRQRLDLPGEWVFGLGGLDIPPAHMNRQLEAYSAVNLFCQCAQQGNQGFTLNDANRESIGEICQLVDGLPLAIRLAAAWTRSLSCAEIAAEIRRGLDILSAQLPPGAEESQSSVRAVFEQSWNRLEPAERDVFACLSVFRGGFDRGAAEQVAGASIAVLTRLVDQSLLRMSAEGRYDLHDLLSQFGAEKLRQAGAEADALRRHFDWYYTQAEQNERMLHGAHALKAFIWLVREAANLRESLAWGHAHEPEQADRLAGWMHAEFHQMGVHVLEREKKERT
jgi:predicted ATPase